MGHENANRAQGAHKFNAETHRQQASSRLQALGVQAKENLTPRG